MQWLPLIMIAVFGALAIFGRGLLLNPPLRIAIASVALFLSIKAIVSSGNTRSPQMFLAFLALMFLIQSIRTMRSSP